MESVTLSEMLDARDIRAAEQFRLIQTYKKPVISLTLNIPGSQKVFLGIPEAYAEGCSRIETALRLSNIPILATVKFQEKTGCEAFYCVDADPNRLKVMAIELEDIDRLGRLFDIDIIKVDGFKISREELGFASRSCLLCHGAAHACSRNRTHSVEELLSCIRSILEERG